MTCNEIKECPFCGNKPHEPVVQRVKGDMVQYLGRIWCPYCGAQIQTIRATMKRAKESVIRQWNQRKNDDIQ